MPELTPEIVELEARVDIQLARRQFIESDLDQKWLAVLTDSDPVLAARMARAAKDKKVLFCAVDAPEFNSYAHVAVARADTLFLAIGTEGRAPALSRRLREELQRLLDEAGADRFVAALAALRQTTPSADRAARLGQAVAALRFTGRLELPELP
jgi:precorrin-2 dehydrogenase/sirohydrochlorin ferrochelatase